MKRFQLIMLLSTLAISSLFPQYADKGYTKYVKSIDQNNLYKAQKFLNKGFDINSRDIDGKTPFLYCLQQDKADFARFFINAGANINLTDYQANTCLHYAIENCRSDDSIVYQLLEKGANFRAINKEGYTPLHFSILYSCYELPFYLINRGADYHLMTGLNESALHLSLESGCDTISYFLLANDINFRQRDNMGNTALLAALDFRRHNLAIKLIEMGANIHEVNTNNFDALLFAVLNQDTKIVKLLLEKGANMERQKDQDPLLYFAANQENADIVELLLLRSAEIPDSCQRNDEYYFTAFIYSVYAHIVPDSLKADYLQKSLDHYIKAKEKYKIELNEVNAKNTGLVFAEILLTASAALTDTYYDPGFDYEAEKRYYLKNQIEKCEDNIDELKIAIYTLTSDDHDVTFEIINETDTIIQPDSIQLK